LITVFNPIYHCAEMDRFSKSKMWMCALLLFCHIAMYSNHYTEEVWPHVGQYQSL